MIREYSTPFGRIRVRRGMAFGVIIIAALLAFEIFNYSTTDFALHDLLGDLSFLSLRWSTILALAFCGIDFAGIARIFTPEEGADEPAEVWYLFGAWLLAATMNAMLTWWGVSIAILEHETLGNAVVDRATLLKSVPIFVAVLVWLSRVLLIGNERTDAAGTPFDALNRYPGILPETLPAREIRNGFPTAPQTVAERWDVVALGEIPSGAGAFADAQLKALADFARNGGGLLVTGGPNAYGSGGYGDTPLTELIPLTLVPGDRQAEPVRPAVALPEARLFERYEAVFPEFGARNRVTLRPGSSATVAAAFEDGVPFLVCSEAGQGRVLCLTAPWSGPDADAFVTWPHYATLLGRAVRWLGKDLPLLPEGP